MKRTAAEAIWILFAVALALLMWFVVTPARAEEEAPVLVLRMRDCAPPECVIVSYTQVMEAVERSNANWERARKAEAELAARKAAGPKCATLEVKPDDFKPLPPLKKERDS